MPVVIKRCVQFLFKYSLETMGLFRVSANHIKLNEMYLLFKRGGDLELDLDNADDHLVSGLLKMYFRKLSSPFIPAEHHLGLIVLGELERKEIIPVLKDLLLSFLKPVQLQILKHLFSMLHAVYEKSYLNLMGSENLAIVWTPTLFHSSNEAHKIVELMIEAHDQIFGTIDIEQFKSNNIGLMKTAKRNTSSGIAHSSMKKRKSIKLLKKHKHRDSILEESSDDNEYGKKIMRRKSHEIDVNTGKSRKSEDKLKRKLKKRRSERPPVASDVTFEVPDVRISPPSRTLKRSKTQPKEDEVSASSSETDIFARTPSGKLKPEAKRKKYGRSSKREH
eukprot:TRINITY_DN580_c0_g1_i5.p1 TRINITY_DN580_c0_g1~~TRINITY_DN580_c0_g1_i5.p1  ORF type:complete len:334 (+),score=70.46 TRINITY_DN580_c0_g1_i5:406-1407(+)